MVADIGGYLGLFLGLSIFGVIDLFQKAILVKRKASSKSSSEENISNLKVIDEDTKGKVDQPLI